MDEPCTSGGGPLIAEPFLNAADRAWIRELVTGACRPSAGTLAASALLADQYRRMLPALNDDTIAAVTAYCAYVTGVHCRLTGCTHVRDIAHLLSGAAADLAHLDPDP